MLLDHETGHLEPKTEALLFAASRAQHVTTRDPAGARRGQGRDLRPLHRLVARLPGATRAGSASRTC